MEEALFLTQPLPVSKLYHVFKVGNRSLCGRFAILFPDETIMNKVEGTETWKKGQDCKSCFKKAGLKT